MDVLDYNTFSQLNPVTATITVLILSLAILYYVLRERGHPPGPVGIPYFGYYPFLKDDTMHLQLQNMMKKYGDVFSLNAVGQLYIHLGTIKALREAHVTKADCFVKRSSEFNVMNSLFGEGVVSANGESWKVQRKFFTQSFRDLGLTSLKDYMTGPIYDSLTSTMAILKEEAGKPFNILPILNLNCTNILRRMMFNDDGITDEEMKDLLAAYEKLVMIFLGPGMLLQGEFSRRVLFPLSTKYNIAMENRKIMVSILKRIIKRHEDTYSKDNIRDLIDMYIKERNERRSKNDPTAEYFTENGLVSSLIQFVGDGITSVAFFIATFIYDLVDHPEEQEKIFNELQEVLGPERQPTLNDKSKLPYTNAFMHEVLRMADFITIFPSIECTKETTLNGYKIPKGAVTLINFWTCHRDPNTFKDPDVFRPSRYITEPGTPKPELPITFGMGKRSCIGEYYTVMQIFLFLTTIAKNFRLTPAEGFSKKALIEFNMQIYAHPRK